MLAYTSTMDPSWVSHVWQFLSPNVPLPKGDQVISPEKDLFDPGPWSSLTYLQIIDTYRYLIPGCSFNLQGEATSSVMLMRLGL